MSREMKDSGVEWIGTVPKSWKITKIKNIASLQTGNSIKASDKDKYTNNHGDMYPYIATKDITLSSNTIDYDNGIFTPIDNDTFKIAKKNSVLLCIEGGSAGKKIAFTNQPVSFVNKLCNLYSHKYSNKYLFYYCLSPAFINQFNMNITGLIGGVSLSKLKQILITLPSKEEQEKIVNFLDEKTTEINNIISKTKQSIEELKAYKQSLITETVTKGLNTDVPMKDSGIEWVGDIPEHWNINMLSNYFYEVKNKNKNKFETNLLSLSYGNIVRKDINTTDGLLPASFENYNILEEGDIVLRMTDLQNDHKSLRTGYVNERGIITSAYITLRTQHDKVLNKKYVQMYLHSFDIHKGFYGMGAGVRQSVNYNDLKKLPIVVPPMEEQNEMVEFLNERTSKINSLIVKKEQLINELETYKQSLIYEYVTGKKEVK